MPSSKRDRVVGTVKEVGVWTRQVPCLAEYTMFLDEHGTISSDRDDEVWGYGYLLVPSEEVQRLEPLVRAKFPNGSHMRGIRLKRRPARVRELVDTLAGFHVFGGAHVQVTHDYGSRALNRVLAGLDEDAGEDQMREVAEAAGRAPVGPRGLVDPADVMPEARSDLRAYVTYMHALRFPIMALDAKTPGVDLRVEVIAGDVGNREAHQRQLARNYEQLCQNGVALYERYATGGIDVTMRCEDAASASPLFAFADAFASVGRQFHLSQGGGVQAGVEMYAAARQIFERLPPVGDRHLAPGITCW